MKEHSHGMTNKAKETRKMALHSFMNNLMTSKDTTRAELIILPDNAKPPRLSRRVFAAPGSLDGLRRCLSTNELLNSSLSSHFRTHSQSNDSICRWASCSNENIARWDRLPSAPIRGGREVSRDPDIGKPNLRLGVRGRAPETIRREDDGKKDLMDDDFVVGMDLESVSFEDSSSVVEGVGFMPAYGMTEFNA